MLLALGLAATPATLWWQVVAVNDPTSPPGGAIA